MEKPVAWRYFQETPKDGGYWVLCDDCVDISWAQPLLAAPPLPVVPQVLLRKLVDVVWQEAKECSEVPATRWADELIGRVFNTIIVEPDSLVILEAALDACRTDDSINE